MTRVYGECLCNIVMKWVYKQPNTTVHLVRSLRTVNINNVWCVSCNQSAKGFHKHVRSKVDPGYTSYHHCLILDGPPSFHPAPECSKHNKHMRKPHVWRNIEGLYSHALFRVTSVQYDLGLQVATPISVHIFYSQDSEEEATGSIGNCQKEGNMYILA
jgi:hypothetical protein